MSRHRNRRPHPPAPNESHNEHGSISRRTWLARAAGLAAGGVAAVVIGERLFALRGGDAARPANRAAGVVATVYANESCSCCHGWMDHLRKAGFDVQAHYVPDVAPYKTKFGVPEALWSCHTARIGKYAIEGHVPADVIRKLLAEASPAAGLAVPGMPVGAPGMEGPNPQRYQVVAFTADGRTSVFGER